MCPEKSGGEWNKYEGMAEMWLGGVRFMRSPLDEVAVLFCAVCRGVMTVREEQAKCCRH